MFCKVGNHHKRFYTILLLGVFIVLLYFYLHGRKHPSSTTDTHSAVAPDDKTGILPFHGSSQEFLDSHVFTPYRQAIKTFHFQEPRKPLFGEGDQIVRQRPGNICQNISHSTPLLFLILVFCEPDKMEFRNAIRSSWSHPAKVPARFVQIPSHQYRTIFILPEASERLNRVIEEENKEHNDILQLRVDPYSDQRQTHLLIKTLYSLKMVKELNNCQPHYILRVNAFTYLNTVALAHWLVAKKTEFTSPDNRFPIKRGYIIGNILSRQMVNRNPEGSGYIDPQDYSDNALPPFPEEPVWMLTRNAWEMLLTRIPRVRPVSSPEIYLGMLAAVEEGPVVKQNDHFMVLSQPSGVCHQLRLFFIHHNTAMGHIRSFQTLTQKDSQSADCVDPHPLSDNTRIPEL